MVIVLSFILAQIEVMWLDQEGSEETTTSRCLNNSTLSNGILFRSTGEAGVVGILFRDTTMYLHLEILKLRLLLEEQFSIAATSFLSMHTVVTLGGDSLK